MPDIYKTVLVVFLFCGLPGGIGAWAAYTKGRNIFGWFLLCFFFPPTLMIALFQKPLREVEGRWRQCYGCSEFQKWQNETCIYCGADLTRGKPIQ